MTEKRLIHTFILLMLMLVFIIGLLYKVYNSRYEEVRSQNFETVRQIQLQVSDYIVDNYVGVEKIEWVGYKSSNMNFNVATSMIINGVPNTDHRNYFWYRTSVNENIISSTDSWFETSNYDGRVQNEMIKLLVD